MADKYRLHEVRSLSSILAKGVEGGKEFARIVDLLLFYEAKKKRQKFTVFNDAAGDYNGLDSFEGDSFRKKGQIGYQYKFFTSPLSDTHRKEIAASLQKAVDGKIKKWILITPDDFIESSTKKSGGDVTWFENLRVKLKVNVEIEHWGHKNLVALFIENPALCLFYYPELVNEGSQRRKTINEIKNKYDENLVSLYKSIEFVGMSIYKPEATKGVPMENIYIPLKVIAETTEEQDSDFDGINPIKFIAAGCRSVILGDPGSGKSTLLKFLSLCGISHSLQEKFKTKSDTRLTVVIVLRRYADELKSKMNLSLIDFIQEMIKADFNLESFDLTFLEYYLETAQTILLFDGLDELPNPNFKEIIRTRINSLNTTYPGNAIIVTSRIVGYDNPFRFSEKDYYHYKVSKLRLPEMKQFVMDWYSVRIENEKERETNVQDLVRILSDEDHIAIRELAENPLLLTIVTLVHRIDAVLPDERVFLYQKCTETLLNTWHTWKFRDIDSKNRGKVERKNRRRMEVIANWMQNQSTGVGKTQRAVIPYSDLFSFIKNYISETEKVYEADMDAEDIATDFIEFIKKRAGLLIEVGDQSYSFVHLTFQEYLTSSNLITSSEKEGITNIWGNLKTKASDPRWYEVIRLLVAGLRSDDSQEFIIENLLLLKDENKNSICPLLLGGFLLDGVANAEIKKKEIILQILQYGINLRTIDEVRSVVSLLKNWSNKDALNQDVIDAALVSLWREDLPTFLKSNLILLSICINSHKFGDSDILSYLNQESSSLLKLFFFNSDVHEFSNETRKNIDLFNKYNCLFTLTSPHLNIVSAAFTSINFLYNTGYGFKKMFEQILLIFGTGDGPQRDLINNLSKISEGEFFFSDIYVKESKIEKKNINYQGMGILQKIDIKFSKNNIRDAKAKRSNSNYSIIREFVSRNLDNDSIKYLVDREKSNRHKINYKIKSNFWQSFQTGTANTDLLLNLLITSFELKPSSIWYEALRVNFIPQIPTYIKVFDENYYLKTKLSFEENNSSPTDAYFFACLILADAWAFLYEKGVKEEIVSDVVRLTQHLNIPQLKIAHCIRDIIYGNGEKKLELKEMFESCNPEYNEIFVNCFWKFEDLMPK